MPISNIILQKCLCFTVLPAQTENQAPAQSFPKWFCNIIISPKVKRKHPDLPGGMRSRSVHLFFRCTLRDGLSRELGSMGLEIGGEIPGQQVVDAAEGIIGDASQHFPQPQFGINSVELRRTEQ